MRTKAISIEQRRRWRLYENCIAVICWKTSGNVKNNVNKRPYAAAGVGCFGLVSVLRLYLLSDSCHFLYSPITTDVDSLLPASTTMYRPLMPAGCRVYRYFFSAYTVDIGSLYLRVLSVIMMTAVGVCVSESNRIMPDLAHPAWRHTSRSATPHSAMCV